MSHNCSEGSTCNFTSRASNVALRESLQSEHNCLGNFTELKNSAFIIPVGLDGLKYWTNYSISSSLCNSQGCGPFASSITARTDEHSPTCAPNITMLYNTSSTSVFASWERTPVHCTHGVLLSFNVFLALETELTGNECFNDSSCWEQRSPFLNQTRFYTTNVTNENITFSGLKKYRRYCAFVQAVNIKGAGPPSLRNCTFTAEDG